MIFACEEHLERAIDEVAEKYQEPPDFFLLSQLESGIVSNEEKCPYCGISALYLVKRYAD